MRNRQRKIKEAEKAAKGSITRADKLVIQEEIESIRRTSKHTRTRVPRKRTLLRQAAIAASGATPLEFLLEGYRFEHNAIQKELQKKRPSQRVIRAAYERGRDFAVAAAPYCHPRLAAVVHKGDANAPIRSVIEVNFVEPGAELAATLDDDGVFKVANGGPA